ncbi:hypothetical protein B0H14DRAFT_3534118 [Mycena olivaceomarginata]|nr:hypothetical protein B0H14DRAFT_3534118 [Mycena olivaceomarginata]
MASLLNTDLSDSSQGVVPYDPYISAVEKEEMRRRYSSLLDVIEAENAAGGLSASIVKADDLFAEVANLDVARLDAEVLLHITTAGARLARNLKSGFDREALVQKAINFMTDSVSETVDWTKMGRLALRKSRRVPVCDLMFGPISMRGEGRVPRVRAAQFEVNEEDRMMPIAVRTQDLQSSEATAAEKIDLVLVTPKHGRFT